jgi:hypothetical protein
VTTRLLATIILVAVGIPNIAAAECRAMRSVLPLLCGAGVPIRY